MHFTVVSLLALAAATMVAAQGPKYAGAPPAGCSPDYNGQFEVNVVLPSHTKRSLKQRQTACAGTGILVTTLKGGILTDAEQRTGSIVANHQFQFDGPPQVDAIYTSGFSVCSNGSLALGPTTVFYQCLSGNFYNLYYSPAGASCEAVEIEVIPCGGSGGAAQGTDGQPTGPSATQAATQITDGQVQASSAGPGATQIGDGQVQASSAGLPVTQIGDGQVQASSAPPNPVSQFTDGQIQITAPVGPAATNAPASQITDGQVQAPVSTPLAPASQASDGQPQVGSATSAFTPSAPLATTGGAAVVQFGAPLGLAVAGLVAVLVL